MPTSQQVSFQLPLLFELAVRFGEVDTRHSRYSKSEDLIDLRRYVFSYYNFSKEELGRLRKDGKTNFLENEHDYASHQLKEAGDLKRIKNVRWEITEQGLCKLRSAFGRLLRDKVDSVQVEAMLSTEDENRDELLIAAIRRVPIELFEYLRIGCSSRRELFVSSISNISPSLLGGFLASGYEEFRSLILQHGPKLRQLYRSTPSAALRKSGIVA